MRLFAAVVLLALTATPSTAMAETRTPAEATAHAIEELVNACAQHKPECPTSTPTVVPTMTPSPTSTSTPQPTDTPVVLEPTATPTPAPCWLTDQDLGDPDNGWIVFDALGAPVPCPVDQVADEPTLEPTPTVTPSPSATPRPAAQPVAAVAVAPAPLPTYTPYPTYTPQPTYTPWPTPTSSPVVGEPTPVVRVTVIAVLVPTSAPSPTSTAAPTVVPTLAPIPLAHVTEPAPGHWEWASFLGYLVAAIGICLLVVAFVLKRRVAVWKGESHA